MQGGGLKVEVRMDNHAVRKHRKVKYLLGVFLFISVIAIILALADSHFVDARNDLSTCPLHNVALNADFVPVFYGGEPDIESEYWIAREAQFPFANSFYEGGCLVKSQKIAIIRYCPACRDAEKEWEANVQPD